jgi:succinyl-CoA synthetase beta subunit
LSAAKTIRVSPVQAERCERILANYARSAMLTEPAAKSFLEHLGVPVPRGEQIRTAKEAPEAAARVGFPIVVKMVAQAIAHKTELGGVVFPVTSARAAEAACIKIASSARHHRPDLVLEGFLLEQYRPASLEWILALRVDAAFGPIMTFGLGGIYVEALRKVGFRLAPMTSRDIDDLIVESGAAPLLSTVRGQPAANLDALKSAIRTLSDLANHSGLIDKISVIEINPLTIDEHGVCALDALITLKQKGDP